MAQRDEPATTSTGLFGIEPFDGENEVRALRLAHAEIDGRASMVMVQAERRVNAVSTQVAPSRST